MSGLTIIALDKITIGARDMQAARVAMERVLAREASQREDVTPKTRHGEVPARPSRLVTLAPQGDARGPRTTHFRLDNMTLELVESDADGLRAVTFGVRDIDSALRTAERRALEPQAPVAFAEGRAVQLSEHATHGVPIRLVQCANTSSLAPAAAVGEGAVIGLDHVVIRTMHPNRAAALYGARLGLDMRLDRTEPKWGARLMFFRCGDLIVEVVHELKDEPSDAPDRLWGLSWRVADAAIAHARLTASGVSVSEMRPGRKPGTRVFTVRDNTLGVPTLMLEPSAPNR